MKILIVDDRPENNYLLESLLQGKGHKTFAGANGKEALEILKKQQIDLIISDILMPVMDGFQLCRQVKTDPGLRPIPFIIYTATYTGAKDEEFAAKIGADRFVIKPCEPKEFLRIIEKVMTEKHKTKLSNNTQLPEEEILMLYNERLVRKLEKKMEDYKKELKERKEAEHDLIASEARYRRLFEAARDGILILDAETGIIQDVNPYLIEMMGLSREKFCGKMLWELGFFEDIASNKANLIELQKKKYIRYEDLPLKTTDGRILDVEFISNVYLVGNRKVIQCNIRNITDRKLAEAELKTQLNLLRIAGETARFGGWSVDLQKNICTWSDAVADIHEMPHGFAPKVEEGINFYAPQWRERITQVFSACAEKGIPYDEEMEIITRTGKRVWVRTIGRAVKNEKGEIIRVEGSFQDITERKRILESLKESETFIKAVLDNLPIGIAVNSVDPQVNFSYMNDEFPRIYRTTRERLAEPDSFWEAIYEDPEFRAELRQRVLDDCASGDPTRMRWTDIPISRQGEETTYISAQNVPVPNQPLMISMVVDITERKKSMEALQQIEWMLSEKEAKDEDFTPEYGDLSEFNKNGLILSSVGKDQLTQIASEYLDLLETSSAIYEINGDYALGLFSSGWCRMLDMASRKLCETDDNQQALNCRKWLCHESCWQDASMQAIESGKPADLECNGGLRLYAVPIRAGEKVIGAINFGYGDPPEADDELQKLSELFQVPIEELRKKGQEYQTRPQYIIDYAKKRIQFSAQYIANIVERKQAETELRRMKDDLEIQVAEKTRELKERIKELERYHDATVNREFRIKELRDEIARLKEER